MVTSSAFRIYLKTDLLYKTVATVSICYFQPLLSANRLFVVRLNPPLVSLFSPAVTCPIHSKTINRSETMAIYYQIMIE